MSQRFGIEKHVVGLLDVFEKALALRASSTSERALNKAEAFIVLE